jgi:hypothetical protein
MFRVTWTYQGQGRFGSAARWFGRLDPYALQRARERVRPIVRQMMAVLHTPAGPVVYPIRWKSERQRRAYFATNGFGRGIPSVRTNRLVNTWTDQILIQGGVLTVSAQNGVPYREFVTGDKQQPFHTRTGWYDDEQVTTFYGGLMAEATRAEWSAMWSER